VSYLWGDLTKAQISEEVNPFGWVQARDKGFIDLYRSKRSIWNYTIVFDPENTPKDLMERKAHQTLVENMVIQVKGNVVERGFKKTQISLQKLIEVLVTALTVLNKALVPPFSI